MDILCTIMATFIGEYRVKIDDKGRVILPAQIKYLFPEGQTIRFVIKRDLYQKCLKVFTYSQWEEESAKVLSRLNLYNRKHAEFWREYMRDRAIVEPEGKLGRMNIPKQMLQGIAAEREIIFAGCDHFMEIWAKEIYEAARMDNSEFTALAEELLG